MSWGIGPEKIGRGYERNLNVGPFQPMVSSFDLYLRDEKKSPKTIRTYLKGARSFAAGNLIPAGLGDWSDVKARRQRLTGVVGPVAPVSASSSRPGHASYESAAAYLRWQA
jgi:hypothetical protein